MNPFRRYWFRTLTTVGLVALALFLTPEPAAQAAGFGALQTGWLLLFAFGALAIPVGRVIRWAYRRSHTIPLTEHQQEVNRVAIAMTWDNNPMF